MKDLVRYLQDVGSLLLLSGTCSTMIKGRERIDFHNKTKLNLYKQRHY